MILKSINVAVLCASTLVVGFGLGSKAIESQEKNLSKLDLDGAFGRGSCAVYGPKKSQARGFFRAGKGNGVGLQLEAPGGEGFFGFALPAPHAVLAILQVGQEAAIFPPLEDSE